MLQRKMDGYPVHSMPNYDFLSGGGYSMKQFVLSNSDGDSSSTKSEQSRQDLSAVSDSSLNGQHTPKQSADNAPDQFEEHQDQEQEYTEQQQGEDNNDSYVKRDQGMVKSVLPLGNPEAALSPPKFDYNQPFACITYPYAADPYYGGVLTGYASNAIVHPQLNGTANSRVPLPVEPAAEEPVFVNVKQYHAILRRRQMRAKLEAQNKLVKGRKCMREPSCPRIFYQNLISQKNSNLHTCLHHLIRPLATSVPARISTLSCNEASPWIGRPVPHQEGAPGAAAEGTAFSSDSNRWSQQNGPRQESMP